jgi:hypothetical protein
MNLSPGEVGDNFYDRFEISVLIFTAVGDVMISLMKGLQMMHVHSDLCAKTQQRNRLTNFMRYICEVETNSWGGVRLNCLVHWSLVVLVFRPRMTDQHGAVCGIRVDRVNQCTQRKSVPSYMISLGTNLVYRLSCGRALKLNQSLSLSRSLLMELN